LRSNIRDKIQIFKNFPLCTRKTPKKGNFDGKMAMFGGFSQNVPQNKSKGFCADIIKTLLQAQSDTSHALNTIFYKKKAGCHVAAVQSLFLRPKMEMKYLFPQNIYFRENSVCRFQT
jgi:hypothetical protein